MKLESMQHRNYAKQKESQEKDDSSSNFTYSRCLLTAHLALVIVTRLCKDHCGTAC